jgi:hypothetical protein
LGSRHRRRAIFADHRLGIEIHALKGLSYSSTPTIRGKVVRLIQRRYMRETEMDTSTKLDQFEADISHALDQWAAGIKRWLIITNVLQALLLTAVLLLA